MNSGAASSRLSVCETKGIDSWSDAEGNGTASWQGRGTKGEAGLLAGGANGEASWIPDKAEQGACRAI